MNLRFKSLISVLIIIASAAVPSAATSEPAPSTQVDYESPNQVFSRAFFANDPNFFRNQTVGRQLNLIFGSGNSFPDDEIRRDADLVNIVYRSAFKQQVSSEPILRTPDLPSPYNTTLLQSPTLNPTNGFESLPLR